MTKSEIIRNYLGSYETGNRDTIEGILSEEFKFKSPQDDQFNREMYFEKCWPMSEFKTVIQIKKIIENENEAFAIYECEMNEKKFRNAEYIKFEGDKIISVEVFFGNEIN